MCWEKIKKWLGIGGEGGTDTGTESGTGESRPLVILHPEESFDPNATVASVTPLVPDIITKWLTDWKVPSKHWNYWRTMIDVHITDQYPDWVLNQPDFDPNTPAFTYGQGGIRHIISKPGWFNPGVVAHEQAHNSYDLLSESKKNRFVTAYQAVRDTDPLIQYLYSINPYGLTNDIEGHADVYRYLCQQMPSSIKQFYPKLL